MPSARNLWVDKCAASYTITAHDVGKVLVFDTTAAARTLSLIAGASFGVPVWSKNSNDRKPSAQAG